MRVYEMLKDHKFRGVALLAIILLLFLGGCQTKYSFVRKVAFKGNRQLIVTFAGPVDRSWAADLSHFTAYEKRSPDILLAIESVRLSADRTRLTLTFRDRINANQPHILILKDVIAAGRSRGTATLTVRKSYFGYLLSILIGAMLVHNFVFTKYLGLCVFFGTSRKRSTAVGMGITFTIVIVFSAWASWFLYQFVLKPYRLYFLEVIVFIGIVSLSVQAVDTILRKVNPVLFKAFGIYLILVIANCIIMAVPLILADNNYNMFESLMLGLGAGLGYLIALFLMSSVRERLEVANVPPAYRGLPIAFIVAGLFALAFLGFSGMSIF